MNFDVAAADWHCFERERAFRLEKCGIVISVLHQVCIYICILSANRIYDSVSQQEKAKN